MFKQSLRALNKVYERGDNIIEHLNKFTNPKKDNREKIMISYDLQSGSYTAEVEKNPAFYENYTQALAEVINQLGVNYNSLLEAGVGEATILANLIPKLKNKSAKIFGFDLSWSRAKFAQEYSNKRNQIKPFIFMGDLFKIPLADNSMDIVYTSHAIESNRGREKEALQELIRVTKKYLILLEPDYGLVGPAAKKRMRQFGYIRNLYSTACSLGLNIIERRLFGFYSNPLNPPGLMIIKKDFVDDEFIKPLVCPITKTPLEAIKGSYFSKEALLAYPEIDGVPCLLEDYAVIATHYLDDFEKIK